MLAHGAIRSPPSFENVALFQFSLEAPIEITPL